MSSVSDEQLLQLFDTAPRIHDYGGLRIVRISKTLVLKGGIGVASSESQNMVFAREVFHLAVPRLHRIFQADIPNTGFPGLSKGYFFVMDYIAGPTVEACWGSLDSSQQQSVAAQVAKAIEMLQSKPLQLPPGPVGPRNDEKFEGPWFTDYGAGPFRTLKDLENWFNHKIDVCLKFNQISKEAARLRFKFPEMVFTHQDIAPRNLILDDKGKVWVIDWGVAGVYPPGFEQAALCLQSKNKEFAEMVLAGLSNRQEKVMEQYSMIGYGLSVAARH